MFLQSLAIRTRLLIDDTLRLARTCLAGDRPAPVRQMELSELEDRVLLSAVPAAAVMPEPPAPAAELDQVAGMLVESANGLAAETKGVALPQDEAADERNSGEGSYGELAAAADVRHELVFVDRGVADYEQLLDGLVKEDPARRLSVVVLDNDRDGVEQISEFLKAHTGLDAIHFVTHGTAGAVKLGNTWLHAG